MAPSVESLYCAEEVSEATWDDEDAGECLHAQPVAESQPAVFLDFPVEDDEAISTLLLKEGQYMPEADYSNRYHAQELSAGARLEAVQWIQKVTIAASPCGSSLESEPEPSIFRPTNWFCVDQFEWSEFRSCLSVVMSWNRVDVFACAADV